MKTHLPGPLRRPGSGFGFRQHAALFGRTFVAAAGDIVERAAVHPVAVDLGVIGVVEQHAVVAVAIADIVADDQPVRKHDGVADVIADRDVAADFAVVGVHVMHREPHLLEAVVDEAVLAAGNREDAVAAVAEAVLGDGDVGRIPDRDAVAGLVAAPALHAVDDIAQHARPRRAMDIDAVQIAFEAVVFDQRALRGLLKEHAGIHLLQIAARSPDGHAADGDIRQQSR